MYLLSTIPPATRASGTARLTQRARAKSDDDRRWYYWRLLVKQRVYKKNRDVLAQLERLERVEKCEETVGEVVGEYERLLRRMEERKERRGDMEEKEGEGDKGFIEDRDAGGEGEANGMAQAVGNGGTQRRERGKRKVVLEEESELEGTPEPKRAKEGGG